MIIDLAEVMQNPLERRVDGRRADELRDVTIERGFNRYAEGSSMIRWGNTVVHCTATVGDHVPAFAKGLGSGWLTAEYAMLPRATDKRTTRDANRGKINGRSSEIQRLIGRSLRTALRMDVLGERTITIDCDVIQADGGTRTASITGAFVCLFDALRSISCVEALAAQVAAVSVGKVNGMPALDLCYDEDHRAEVDSNVVMNTRGEFVELQGTGEGGTFSRSDLDDMLRLADIGLQKLFEIQRECLDLDEREKRIFAEAARR